MRVPAELIPAIAVFPPRHLQCSSRRIVAALFAFPIRRLAKTHALNTIPERLCALGPKQLSKLAGREGLKLRARHEVLYLRRIRHSGALTTQMDQETKMPIWTKFALSVA